MNKKKLVHYLPVYGCIATAIIYACIGVIALLSFFRVRHGGADEYSVLAILYEYLVGKIVVVVILAGTLCYIIWRIYEAYTDPYAYGTGPVGIGKRLGIVLSTVADGLIVYAAWRIFSGTSHIQLDGRPEEEQAMVNRILQWNKGAWIITGIGGVYLLTAIVQWWYGISKGYKERVDIERFPRNLRHVIHVLAWLGYAARGFILGIIGFFYIKAGCTHQAKYIVNTDKAFDFIGDHIGHVWFIIAAIATICYSIFMFVQGLGYDTDKD